MVNQLGKFIPGLADLNGPLRQLLRRETTWYLGEAQETAFQRVKQILLSPEVLAHYDPNLPHMPHQLGLEQFSFRLRTMDSVVISLTSQDPLLTPKEKENMWSSIKKLLSQSGM